MAHSSSRPLILRLLQLGSFCYCQVDLWWKGRGGECREGRKKGRKRERGRKEGGKETERVRGRQKERELNTYFYFLAVDSRLEVWIIWGLISILLYIHSFRKHLSSGYCVLSTLPDSGGTV